MSGDNELSWPSGPILCQQLYGDNSNLHKHNMGTRNRRGRVLDRVGQLLVDAQTFACYDFGDQLADTCDHRGSDLSAY
jgi:hypothetical protein